MKALEKKHLAVLFLLFATAFCAFCADEEAQDIEIPEEFEGVQDVVDIESGAAIEGELPQFEGSSEIEEYNSFIDSVKKIRMLETREDVFSASVKESGKRQLTSSANGKVQRRFYDDDLRLDKVEYWSVSSSSQSGVLERVVTYNPVNKSTGLHSIFESDYSANTETRTFYHPNGKVKSRRKNFFDDKKNLTAFEIYTCSYDKSFRLLQERLQKYSVNGKAVELSGDELHITKYSGNKMTETSYYKDSVLRVRTFYTTDEDYVRATYFDGGVIVRDFYRGNIKVSSSINGGDRHED